VPFWAWILVCLGALPPAGLFYQWFGSRRDRRRFAAPGRMVQLASGIGIHLRDRGDGPAVWLEAGLAASSVGWKPVEEALLKAGFRILAMDRAGYGWSGTPSTPRTMDQLLEELRETLLASGAPLPLIMVGHSFGGLLLRHYAARYGKDVAALVLLDPLEPFEFHPLTPHQAARLGKGRMLSRRGATLARFGVVRFALDLLLAGGKTIPKLLARLSSGRGSAVTDRLAGEVRKLPADLWPVVVSHWCLPRSFRTMVDYLELLPQNCAAPLNPLGCGPIPIVVVSAGNAPEEVRSAHARTVAGTNGGWHVVADGSGHWVHLDRPEIAAQIVTRLMQSNTKQDWA